MSEKNREHRYVVAARIWIRALALQLLFLSSLAGAESTAVEPAKAQATLPLGEILELYRERDEAKRAPEAVPPLPASLQQLQLTGRLLSDGIDFHAHFEVIVLGDDEWVSIPLLAYDEGSHVSQLPEVKDGAFAVSEGQLVFLTQKRGRYRFDLSLYRAATKEGRLRQVRLAHGGAALSTCKLEIDGGLFQLRTEGAIEAREGVTVFPRGDAFEIAWEVRADAEPEPGEPTAAPAIESMIPRVHVSTVSTLEGRRISRVLYELRFAGRKPIAIDLPPDHTLQRAFLNGVATPVEPSDGRIELEVAPARAGEEGGSLELVLVHAAGIFNLAGAMHFDLPAVSWPTHELFFTVNLPGVFDYTWAGGSLAPSDKAPKARYSYRVPLPGEPLHFHQYLIDQSAPDLDLDYEVDLDGNYFHEERQAGRGAAQLMLESNASCSGPC